MNRLKMETECIAVVGLGYVGLPIAHAFSKETHVIGFDINREKIERYKNGEDLTNEIGDDELKGTKIHFTYEEKDLNKAKFVIIAVPTSINNDYTPDLSPLEKASAIVGRNLSEGTIVVYESTVYPGVTEDVCVPILERESHLICGRDFKVGYSLERINPGDQVHRLPNIVKIVSGMDGESVVEIKRIYELIIDAGTYMVSSIKTAEAIKVVENSQRDINIAFMNELAMVFDRMGIDTNEVVNGMNTKWNALGFRPGLVGGHCIGVDPYYFTYEAERLGYHSQMILNGRVINNSMGNYIADITVKKMVEAGLASRNSKVGIIGITFKEDCPDIRNSRVIDVVNRLREYGISPLITDSIADAEEVKNEYGIDLIDKCSMKGLDRIILAVSHNEYRKLKASQLLNLFTNKQSDKKNVFIE